MNTANTPKLYLAILEVQKKVSVLKKDEKNPFFKSQYLSLAGLIEALQPVLVENGLIVMQHPLDIGQLKTQVIHAASGEVVESTMEIPPNTTAAITPQTAGSLVSYLRRYSLMAIFNIAAEDDDSNSASGYVPPKATKTYTVKTTDAKCGKCGANMTISKATGKEYCIDKCWLKKQAPMEEAPIPDITDAPW